MAEAAAEKTKHRGSNVSNSNVKVDSKVNNLNKEDHNKTGRSKDKVVVNQINKEDNNVRRKSNSSNDLRSSNVALNNNVRHSSRTSRNNLNKTGHRSKRKKINRRKMIMHKNKTPTRVGVFHLNFCLTIFVIHVFLTKYNTQHFITYFEYATLDETLLYDSRNNFTALAHHGSKLYEDAHQRQ